MNLKMHFSSFEEKQRNAKKTKEMQRKTKKSKEKQIKAKKENEKQRISVWKNTILPEWPSNDIEWPLNDLSWPWMTLMTFSVCRELVSNGIRVLSHFCTSIISDFMRKWIILSIFATLRLLNIGTTALFFKFLAEFSR